MQEKLARSFEADRKLINQRLDQMLPDTDRHPAPLYQAMRYAVLNGGKRLRPILVLMVNRLLDGEIEAAIPVACAVELIHSSSLVFDDLPSMDDASLRRGKPALHKAFPEGIALMAADALMNKAFEVVCSLADRLPASSIAEILRLLSETIGPDGMVGGQAADLQSSEGTSYELLEFIHIHKTAVLFVNSALLGAMSAMGDSDDRKRVSDYARHLGLAFQIIDDTLDYAGSTDVTGKQTGTDSRQDRMTFVRYHGLEKARQLATDSGLSALAAIESYGESAWALKGLARYVLERNR